jgi:hypothetical protein
MNGVSILMFLKAIPRAEREFAEPLLGEPRPAGGQRRPAVRLRELKYHLYPQLIA